MQPATMRVDGDTFGLDGTVDVQEEGDTFTWAIGHKPLGTYGQPQWVAWADLGAGGRVATDRYFRRERLIAALQAGTADFHPMRED